MAIPSTSRFGLQDDEVVINNKNFQASCETIAKIDIFIARNEVPENVQVLASHLIKLSQSIYDEQSKAFLLLLMLSVKEACNKGWFAEKDTKELMDIINSLLMDFGIFRTVVVDPVPITQVIERFYPSFKLKNILVSFEAKAETKATVNNFLISERILPSPEKMIGLFVVATEDMSKSNCLVHPRGVSFMLNGRTITNRDYRKTDTSPQLPTDVTSLLIGGTNLLQTIGRFQGNYFIAIASVDIIPIPEKPLLEDHVHSKVTESNSDCDIIEGASKISLLCPISRTRIKFPVKGRLCKHLQCFDFWNYVNMNLRRPSWRCPDCNHTVCYNDICVDQNMTMILEEVGDNAEAVIVAADGSWTVVTETDEDMEVMPETANEGGVVNKETNVMDLTGDDNEMETSGRSSVNNLLTRIFQPSNSTNAQPQLPQTLNVSNGQQQFGDLPRLVDIQDSSVRGGAPNHRLATNTSSLRTSQLPNGDARSSRFQGSHAGQFSSPFQVSHAASAPSQFQVSHAAAQSSRFQGSHVGQSSSPFQASHAASAPSQFQVSHAAAQSSRFQGSHVGQSSAPFQASHAASAPFQFQVSHAAAQSSRFQGSHLAQSSQFQGSHVGPPRFQGSHVGPSQRPGSHVGPFQGSHVGPHQFQGSHVMSFQYQGPHVASLGHGLVRNSGLMESWNQFCESNRNQIQSPVNPHYYPTQNQTFSVRNMSVQRPMIPSSVTHSQPVAFKYVGTANQRPMPSSQNPAGNYVGTANQRPMPSSQNLAGNYVGTANQRPMPSSQNPAGIYVGTANQRRNPNGTMGGGHVSSRENFGNMISPETGPPQMRMRGSIVPGTTVHDHMMIRPTQPVQTLPSPHVAQPSYNETQGGTGSMPMGDGVGYWSTPPAAW